MNKLANNIAHDKLKHTRRDTDSNFKTVLRRLQFNISTPTGCNTPSGQLQIGWTHE